VLVVILLGKARCNFVGYAVSAAPERSAPIEKARTVAEAIRARRVAQAWLARQHIRETTDFQFNETGTPHGDASVVAVMWRGLFKAMLESAETYGEGAS